MSKQIRVLHVIGRMNRGGTEAMIMNLYRHIDKSKVQFDFVVHYNGKGDYDDEIKNLGGKIYYMPRFIGTNICNYYKAWKGFFDNHKEYQIIHGHIGSSAAIYLKLAKKYGCYTIAHSHSTGTEAGLKGKIYSILAYPTRYIADYFFACSEAAGIARYGKKVVSSRDRFYILKNAVKIESFMYSESVRNKKRDELNLKNQFVIGHIGRFDSAKNQSFLIDIFKEIHDKNKKSTLLLVGDGELRESIEEKVKNLGLYESVIFTGVRSDVMELLQAMDIFVFPSLYEGLGIVTIEAQAAGLQCVVADTIPKEAYVTNLIKSISLKEPADTWEEVILKFSEGYERRDTFEEIKSSGYDINSTTQWLMNFYMSRVIR